MHIFRSCAFLICFSGSALAEAPPLPPALQHLANDSAMIAIWNHEARTVDTPDMADAAQRILFALSYHVAGCSGPDAVTIPIRVSTETVTRDGLGIVRERVSDSYERELKVRPEFADLARRTVGHYSDNVMNSRFVGVRDLISQDRCDGPRLRHLEEGLALAAGVALTPAAPIATDLGADWRGFVMDCVAATFPSIINSELNAARICNVAEAALVEIGNSDWYAAFRAEGLGAGSGLSPDEQARFNAAFDPIYADHGGPVHTRGEQFVREAGLF